MRNYWSILLNCESSISIELKVNVRQAIFSRFHTSGGVQNIIPVLREKREWFLEKIKLGAPRPTLNQSSFIPFFPADKWKESGDDRGPNGELKSRHEKLFLLPWFRVDSRFPLKRSAYFSHFWFFLPLHAQCTWKFRRRPLWSVRWETPFPISLTRSGLFCLCRFSPVVLARSFQSGETCKRAKPFIRARFNQIRATSQRFRGNERRDRGEQDWKRFSSLKSGVKACDENNCQ